MRRDDVTKSSSIYRDVVSRPDNPWNTILLGQEKRKKNTKRILNFKNIQRKSLTENRTNENTQKIIQSEIDMTTVDISFVLSVVSSC